MNALASSRSSLRKRALVGLTALAALVVLGGCGDLEEVANALAPAEQKPVEKDFVISGANFYVNPNGKILNKNDYYDSSRPDFITNTKKTIETREKIKPYLFSVDGKVVGGLEYLGEKNGVHTYNFTNDFIDKKFVGGLEKQISLYEERENSNEKENETIGTFKSEDPKTICGKKDMSWDDFLKFCND